jgi:hypothetical protein
MRRCIAYLFLFLYLYNLAGYLAVFSVRQNLVRSEIKKMLKESVPPSELIQLAFHSATLEAGGYPIQWIEDHEFRYAGGMYDIVRSRSTADSTYFLCVNDVQEEQLFANLDSHVQREMGSQGVMLDGFKDVYKNSYRDRTPVESALIVVATHEPPAQRVYESIEPEVNPPPPRIPTGA